LFPTSRVKTVLWHDSGHTAVFRWIKPASVSNPREDVQAGGGRGAGLGDQEGKMTGPPTTQEHP